MEELIYGLKNSNNNLVPSRSVPRYLSDNDELEPDLGNGTEALGNTDLVPHQSDNDHESTEVPYKTDGERSASFV